MGKQGMSRYLVIAGLFEKAIGYSPTPQAFAGAIRVMRTNPELCANIPAWDETLWSIIEDYLNSGTIPVDWESFEYACALLESEM